MKKIIVALLIIAMMLSLCLTMQSCNGEPEQTQNSGAGEATGLWKNATYTEDATVGEGSKTVTCKMELEGKSITITLKTDKTVLGEALYEHKLVNDPSFFDTLNGVKADWSADKAYWCFYIGDEMANVGIDDAKISGGEQFKFVYTK